MEALKWFTEKYDYMVGEMLHSSHHHMDMDGIISVNPYHMEGDVWSHTMMVLNNAMHRYPNFKNLHIAALLHDIGKPVVREQKDETCRTRFFNHEAISFYLAADILKDMFQCEMIDSRDRIEILKIIALHGDFFDVFTHKNCNDDTVKDLREKFSVVGRETFEGVLRHVECDNAGRFFDEEMENDLTFEWFLKSDIGNIQNHKATDRDIVFMVGPPCSGKSTYIQESTFCSYSKVSRDDFVMEVGGSDDYNVNWNRVDQKEIDKLLGERFQTIVKANEDIVVDMTNMSKKSRRRWTSHLPAHYRKTAVVMASGYDEMMKRNFHRDDKKFEFDKVIVGMMRNFVFPMGDEMDAVKVVLS